MLLACVSFMGQVSGLQSWASSERWEALAPFISGVKIAFSNQTFFSPTCCCSICRRQNENKDKHWVNMGVEKHNFIFFCKSTQNTLYHAAQH